jgi:putative transposase
MPVNSKYIESFEAEAYFHIYCKAVGNNVLFKSEENRNYFLKKYAAYSSGYFDTYAYCLLDNHAHWLVKCQPEESLAKHLANTGTGHIKTHQKRFLKGDIGLEEAVEFQMKDFFIAYSLAYNKMYGRNGGLFISPFRRVLVNDDHHFTHLIIYIHANPLKHKLLIDFQNYKWSSYQSLLSDQPTLLQREQVINWFGNKDLFIKAHYESAQFYYDNPFSIE